MNKRGFASDNNSGMHPEIIKAMANANQGHVVAYGDDIYTERAKKILKQHFGEQIDCYFVLTGTAANVLSITTMGDSYNSVICAETAHIYVDECGAPEKYSGCKLLPVHTPDGKLTPDIIQQHLHGIGFEHHSQPGIISLSQPTEMGTVYSTEELRTICNFAHANNLMVHMDGARLANAAVYLDKNFTDITRNVGIDVVSFGGTKNGMLFGECVIFFKPELSKDFKYIRKQGMQLASKMRFVSAQFEAYLSGNLWKENALHANKMAGLLYEKVKSIPGIEVTQKVDSNAVFARIPKECIQALQNEFFFYVWDESSSEVRWMTSFDTTVEDIETFVAVLEKMVGKSVNEQ